MTNLHYTEDLDNDTTDPAPACETCGLDKERLAAGPDGLIVPDPLGDWHCYWCDPCCLRCADLTGTCDCY
jgi:hypothetical protein